MKDLYGVKKGTQLFWGKAGFGYYKSHFKANKSMKMDGLAGGGHYVFPYNIRKGQKVVKLFNPHSMIKTSVVPMSKLRRRLK